MLEALRAENSQKDIAWSDPAKTADWLQQKIKEQKVG
jgi:hypothetical protein